MPKQRYVIVPPNLDALAALTFAARDEPAILNMLRTTPGIVGVQVTIHDDGQWATVAGTDESGMAAIWTTPVAPIVDASNPDATFPDLQARVPVGTPMLRVRVDAGRLAALAAAASEVCGGKWGREVELLFYRAGSAPSQPDKAAPIVIRGAGVHGGVFLGLLQPIIDPPTQPESTT